MLGLQAPEELRNSGASEGPSASMPQVDPDLLMLLAFSMRDARTLGHCSTGDLEIAITSFEDLEHATPHIVQAHAGLA